MKLPREVWWIAGLTALMLIVVHALGATRAEKERKGIVNRTTYSSNPYGLRALYLTLRELGYDVRRLRAPLRAPSLPEQGTLVIVDPFPITGLEWRDVHDWVAAGNTVVLAGGVALPDVTRPESGRSWLSEPRLAFAEPTQPTYLARGVKRLAIRSDYRIAFPRAAEQGPPHETHEESEEELCSLCELTSSALHEALSAAAPVLADEEGVVTAYARVGDGRAVLFCSPWSLSNEGIAEEDNLIFALNALAGGEEAPICFDEYHHGYGESMLWQMLPLPVKLGLAQLVLGVVLIALARSPRLGPVVPLRRGGRQRSEFLGTMTSVLQRGRATHLALGTAYEAAVERLKTEFGLPPDADRAALAQAARRLDAEAGERLEVALSEVHVALSEEQAPSEARAASLVRGIDEAVAAARRIPTTRKA